MGNQLSGPNLLKKGFLELKRRIRKSASKKGPPPRKRGAVSLELTKDEYEMLCDGLDRASVHEKLEFENFKLTGKFTEARNEIIKLGRNSDGYRSACRVLGLAPGRRQKKYSSRVHAILYKHLVEIEKLPREDAIQEISKELGLKPTTVFKELKISKGRKDSILKGIKLPWSSKITS
jgi:hypothetical protein